MARLTIIPTQKEIHDLAVEKGFWKDGQNIGEKIALIHSELSEGLEAYRTCKFRGEAGWIGEELADAAIRIMDLAEHLQVNLEEEIYNKHLTNKERPHKHGKDF